MTDIRSSAYIRPGAIRVEWQLYELDNGVFHRCPPKDDSHRTVHVPNWLNALVADHIALTRPQPCACHGFRYVFTGYGSANGAARQSGPKLVDVARLAGVSTGTVSNVLSRPEVVEPSTQDAVQAAIETLGYVRGVAAGTPAAQRLRHLAVPAGGHRLVPGESPGGGPAGR